MKIAFDEDGWDDYVWWQAEDRKVLRRINELIKSIARDGCAAGLGKPELLRGDLQGLWSRRITQEHRLVYDVVDGEVVILACRFHYA